MVDNIDITPGTGKSVRTDDVSGVHMQIVKLDGGGDGLSVPIVAGQQTMAASMPVVVASNQTAITIAGAVTGPLTDTQLRLTAVPVTVAAASAVIHGQKTVAAPGTEEALGSSTVLFSGVRIKALHGNTGWIYVGVNPVTSSTGFVLDAGEEVFVEVANLATVYIDSSVAGEGVSYLGS